MLITNGGRVVNGVGLIGSNPASSNNLTVVAVTGSGWTSRDELRVGHSGACNKVVVCSGGRLTANDALLGASAGSDNTSIAISGVVTILTSLGIVNVGDIGSGSQMWVTNSGSANASAIESLAGQPVPPTILFW